MIGTLIAGIVWAAIVVVIAVTYREQRADDCADDRSLARHHNGQAALARASKPRPE